MKDYSLVLLNRIQRFVTHFTARRVLEEYFRSLPDTPEFEVEIQVISLTVDRQIQPQWESLRQVVDYVISNESPDDPDLIPNWTADAIMMIFEQCVKEGSPHAPGEEGPGSILHMALSMLKNRNGREEAKQKFNRQIKASEMAGISGHAAHCETTLMAFATGLAQDITKDKKLINIQKVIVTLFVFHP